MKRREFNFALLSAACVSLFELEALSLQSIPKVDGKRLNDNLKALSEFGKNPQGGVSRVAYSQADLMGREQAMTFM